MHLFTAFSMSNEEAVADPRNMLIYDMYKFLRAAPCPAVTGRRQWHATWPPGLPPRTRQRLDNGRPLSRAQVRCRT